MNHINGRASDFYVRLKSPGNVHFLRRTLYDKIYYGSIYQFIFQITKDCLTGEGFDRHLFGLRNVAAEKGIELVNICHENLKVVF